MLLRFNNWLKCRRFKFYNSIEYLPIWNFKNIELTGDFRYLIKNIDYEYLPNIVINKLDTWNKIYSDYLNELDPLFLNDYKASFITIEAKKRECIFVYGCIKILSIERNPELILRIRNLGYRFNDSTEDDYYNSIIDLNRQMDGLIKVISQKSDDFKNKYKQEKITKTDIEDTMILFTQLFGVHFDSKRLTTKQYIYYLKKYNKEAIKQTNGR
mgnify:CR=1 FL=1